MKYALAEEQACKRVFAVELDPAEVRHCRDHAISHIAAHAQIPGFRAGKIPASVLVSRFGKQIDEEFLEHAVSHGARAVLSGTGLKPIVSPTVSDIQPAGEGMTYKITIETAPEVVLGSYEGLALVREPVVVRPEDVDSIIEGMRRRMATYADAPRAAQWGDLAVLDYRGTVDGASVEGSDARDVMIFIGAGETMRPLEEALVGKKAGDAFSVDVPYPADHANPALAGRTAVLAVAVKQIKTGKLPAADDTFAKGLGDYPTVEALRTAVRGKLVAEKEREVRDRLRQAVAGQLVAFAPAEVAPTLVEDEMSAMAMRGAEELARSGIRNIEQLRLTPRAFRDLYRPAAIRAVREAFVLEAISRKEGLSVSDEDLEREIREGREGRDEEFSRAIAGLKQDGRWERLRHRLLQDRTLDWVIARAKVTERRLGM